MVGVRHLCAGDGFDWVDFLGDDRGSGNRWKLEGIGQIRAGEAVIFTCRLVHKISRYGLLCRVYFVGKLAIGHECELKLHYSLQRITS